MTHAVARAKSEATPAKPAAPKAAPVLHRASGDSRRYGLSGRVIQPALRISAAHDPAEREAEQVAAQVTRANTGQGATGLQRSPLLVQRRAPAAGAGGGGMASPVVEARVRAAATGGSPLVPDLRRTLEPKFRADFSAVRLHTDANAAALATAIGARAFTFGQHIFFNTGQYQPQTPAGLELLAHELTHTIQQQAVIQRAVAPAPVIQERTGPEASRLGLSDALNYFADAANAIPGYRMFTILIGVNPINMRAVEASAANILRAIVEFLPGGFIITRVLDSYGIFDRVGSWIEGQLKSLGITGAAIRAAIDAFLGGLSWSDIFALGSLWDRAKSIFTTPISRILTFARSLFGEILRFVREAVLRPLAALAEGTAGYGLLKAVIGFDPVTGEAVPRTAETIIGGFMTMIGQQELWENIKRANAIARAWAWFQGALGGLMGLVRSIPERFMAALRGLEITDFVVLPSAFVKLARVFGTFLVDFGRWALGTVLDLLRIIVEVVAPGVMPYLRRAAGAFNTIIANPVRFVQTLVRAAVQGFSGFASRFLTHLRASLIGWLTGSMAGTGVYIPQAFSLREILKFGLSVLGLTWANIRAKLVRATNETVVVALETGFDIVRTLVTEGPAAAWQKIVETLTNLKDMVIEQVMAFVQSRIVQAAVTKLLSMLSPAGALIQAIIATYNTIMFFVERLRQIAQVAASFIDAIATIAAGNIGPAAARVETTLAGLLTLVISFLARIAGLGRVSDAVKNVIDRIRAPIDRALDRVVDWIVAQARRLGRFVAQAGVPHDPNERLRLASNAAISIAGRLRGRVTAPILDAALAALRTRYGLTSLTAFERNGSWRARLVINPTTEPELLPATSTPAGTASTPGGTSPAPATSVVPLTTGAWILHGGAYEQVTTPASVLRRLPDGRHIPTTFITVRPGGGNNHRSYSAEGSAWTRTTFVHTSKLVVPLGGARFKLQPERDRNYIREEFYRDTSSSRSAIVRSKLPALLSRTNPNVFLSEGDPSQEALQGYTTRDPASGRALVPVANASPDHNPPIASHWNGPGSKNNQTFRESWNRNPTTFRIMSLRLNLSLGSGGATYSQEVGVNFRGPGEP